MKLYIPRLGDKLSLISPWSFYLQPDGRNITMWQLLGLPTRVHYNGSTQFCKPTPEEIQKYNMMERNQNGYVSGYDYGAPVWIAPVTLPTSTQLIVDRIYIRKGARDFDSVTFSLVKNTYPGFTHGKARFWVNLDYVNTMEFETV